MLEALFIVRHAHPLQGTDIPYDRVPGPPLSEVGRAEARAAALYLSNCGLARLFTSPLDRALQTAAAIAEETRLSPVVDEGVAEMRNDEPFERVRGRMRDFQLRLEADGAGPVAVVTHGSPIRALLQGMSGDAIDLSGYNFPGGNPSPTAGIWRASRNPSGWALELIFEPARIRPN